MMRLAAEVGNGVTKKVLQNLGWLAIHAVTSTGLLMFAEGYRDLGRSRIREILWDLGVFKRPVAEVMESTTDKKLDKLIEVVSSMNSNKPDESSLILVTDQMPKTKPPGVR